MVGKAITVDPLGNFQKPIGRLPVEEPPEERHPPAPPPAAVAPPVRSKFEVSVGLRPRRRQCHAKTGSRNGTRGANQSARGAKRGNRIELLGGGNAGIG